MRNPQCVFCGVVEVLVPSSWHTVILEVPEPSPRSTDRICIIRCCNKPTCEAALGRFVNVLKLDRETAP